MTLWVCSSVLFYCNNALGANVVFEHSPLFTNLKPGEKGAILIVHFGTTHDDTRALTLDAINTKIQNSHPELEVREAYTSRIVIKRLYDRGIQKLNPRQALAQLKTDGFTHILVQATTIVNGVEMLSLQREVEAVKEDFKEVRLATSLLFHESDYGEFTKVLTQETPSDAVHLWVGHGTYDVSTAQYAMLDHYLHSSGYKNVVVGCVEGYPYYEQAIQRIKATGLKKVILQPLMIVAGDHAKADIAEDWKEQLEADGYEVEVRLIGLGQLPDIQQLLLEKINFYSQNRRVSIMEKKKVYEVTGEKMKLAE